MDGRQKRMSVLMFPWLAHGHASPFLELAKKLIKKNFFIYFCSTPVNLNSIKPKISRKHSLSIQFVELHLPSLPDLPPHYHTTNGLPPHLMNTLKKAFDMSSLAFDNILKTLNPDLLIYDFIQPWAPALALSHNIPAVHFLCASAVIASFFFHTIKKPCQAFPFPEIYIDDALKTKFSNLLENSSVLLNKKTVPTGPLVQDPTEEDDEKKQIFEWLSKKTKSSTVFVSFGSEYFLSKEEREELAYGIELSQAPQAKILQHSSIGGFVSHCGWGSVMESLKFGVPIIAVPMHLDQPLNARLVDDIGVGLEVRRNKDGSLERKEIAKVIKEVVAEKDGEKMRSKARELNNHIKKKGDEDVDEVVEELIQLCEMKTAASCYSSLQRRAVCLDIE
ncbi:hypothetical protein DITRI_Ditri12bG0102200 [Diplodiscus trichospermus]